MERYPGAGREIYAAAMRSAILGWPGVGSARVAFSSRMLWLVSFGVLKPCVSVSRLRHRRRLKTRVRGAAKCLDLFWDVGLAITIVEHAGDRSVRRGLLRQYESDTHTDKFLNSGECV